MNREKIVSTLELVRPALAKDNTVPVFQCFAFMDDTVQAFNHSIGILATIEETVDRFAVSGDALLKWLSAANGEEVAFQLEDKDHEVVFKCGRSTAKLPYMGEDDFLFEMPDVEQTLSLPVTEDTVVGLEACLVTSSTDLSQPALMGVVLRQSDKFMRLYSCDADTITRYTTTIKAVKDDAEYTLSNAFCEAVCKIARALEFPETTLELDEKWAKATFDGGMVVYGQLIDNRTPLDHGELITKLGGAKPPFVKLPADLSGALARARILGDAESAKTKLTVEQGRLKLVTETRSSGTARDSLVLPKHPDVQTQVSAALLSKLLDRAEEIAIGERCTVLRNGEKILQMVSNLS